MQDMINSGIFIRYFILGEKLNGIFCPLVFKFVKCETIKMVPHLQKSLLLLGVGFLLIFSVSCSNESSKQDEPFLLKVNNYTLSQETFNTMLKFELDADRSFDKTGDTRAAFLNDLVRKQLLIQQAQSQHLDREEKFRQTIQRYWESTLIRDLLSKKSVEFKNQTAVTPEEVKSYFSENEADFMGQPFEVVAEDIQKMIERQRTSELMEKWVEELVKNANIQVADPELEMKMKAEMERTDVY